MPVREQEYFDLLGWRFDVTRGGELVRDREPVRVDVSSLSSWLGWIRVDEEHAMSEEVRLEVPLLIGQFRVRRSKSNPAPALQVLVLDGHHRIAKAQRKGQEHLTARVLTEAETWQIVTRNQGLLERPPGVGRERRE
jgi:hypothetical protein